MLYKSPVWKRKYQNLVKIISFERYFSNRDDSFFLGGGGEGQNFKLAGAKSL